MGTLPRSAPGSGEPGRGRVGGYRALRRQGWKFSLTQPPRPGPAPDSGKRELGGGRSRVLTALSLGGLPLPLGVVSRAVPPAAPAPFSPPESHRWGRVALGTAAGSPQPRLRCGQAPVPPPLPGACTGEAVLLRGRGMAKIRGRHPGLRSAPRGTANAARRRSARGTGSCPGEAPRVRSARRLRAPPQPARLVRPQPGAGPRDVRLLGEEKKKKLHTCTKNAFSVRGGSEGSRCRCAEERAGEIEEVSEPPPATLPHPLSSAPAPTEPLQGSVGPGGGGRGLPPPGGKIAEIAAPGATGQSPARWGLRTARSRPLFMEESSVHMYLV